MTITIINTKQYSDAKTVRDMKRIPAIAIVLPLVNGKIEAAICTNGLENDFIPRREGRKRNVIQTRYVAGLDLSTDRAEKKIVAILKRASGTAGWVDLNNNKRISFPLLAFLEDIINGGISVLSQLEPITAPIAHTRYADLLEDFNCKVSGDHSFDARYLRLKDAYSKILVGYIKSEDLSHLKEVHE